MYNVCKFDHDSPGDLETLQHCILYHFYTEISFSNVVGILNGKNCYSTFCLSGNLGNETNLITTLTKREFNN